MDISIFSPGGRVETYSPIKARNRVPAPLLLCAPAVRPRCYLGRRERRAGGRLHGSAAGDEGARLAKGKISLSSEPHDLFHFACVDIFFAFVSLFVSRFRSW